MSKLMANTKIFVSAIMFLVFIALCFAMIPVLVLLLSPNALGVIGISAGGIVLIILSMVIMNKIVNHYTEEKWN